MPSFTGSVKADKGRKEIRVEGEWEKTSRGWSGGIATEKGKLPLGPYMLKIDGAQEEVKIHVSGRTQIPQAFIGIGPAPTDDKSTQS